MLFFRKSFVVLLALSAVSVALAAPTQSQPAQAATPVTQVIVWGDSMSLAWGAYLEPLLGVPVLRKGVGSEDVQQTETRFNTWLAETPLAVRNVTGHLCWCGGVNANIFHQGTEKDLSSVVPVLQRMAGRAPAGLFQPLSLPNMPEAARGTDGYKIAIDDMVDTTATAVNEQMAVAFGDAYAEVRRYMVEFGLADAGITPTAADRTNIDQDVVPQSLRRDAVDPHLNDAGKHVVASRLNTLLRADGWVPPDTRRATTTHAVSSANPSMSGSPIRVTATVSNATTAGGTPTGTVQFSVDGRPVGNPIALNTSGSALSPVMRNLSVGSHSISATYSGNPTFASSNDSITQVVNGTGQTNLTSAITASSAPASPTTFGQRFRVVATVTNASGVVAPRPTGTVQFRIDGKNAGRPVTLTTSGTATSILSPASLARGTHTVTATYSGSATYLSSTVAYSHVVT